MTDFITTIRFLPDDVLVVEGPGGTFNLVPGDQVTHYGDNHHPVFRVQYLFPSGGEGEMRRTGIEVRARISNTIFGVSKDQPALSFTAQVNPELSERLYLLGDAALNLLREHRIFDVVELNGRLCWVDVCDEKLGFLRLEKEEEDEEDEE